MKKALKEFAINILAIIAFAVVCLVVANRADRAQDRVASFEKERDDHVIETWRDGRDATGHECKYGSDWCNPVYCKHLLSHKAK